jgi:WhiB family redox-sensing transcriptional regulator
MSTARPSRRSAGSGDSEWVSRGACRDVDPESLFVVGAAQNKAKAVCNGCPVRVDCLADALDSRTEFGVWGGMTERERRILLRRRPDVRSWRHFFASQARAEEYAAAQAR